MAKKSLTLDEIKEKKIDLESTILDMVTDFEEETGVKLSYIHFDRPRLDEDRPIPVDEERGPITNVDISMQILDTIG